MESKESARATSRHEKSLGLLTMKFVGLLRGAEDGVLDLKAAADSLAVKQKRRIYDITNVLEGVGLIEKKNKNIIQWRGQRSICSQTEELQQQVGRLKAQISQLEAEERELDQQRVCLEESIHELSHSPTSSSYTFVTHEDVCRAFEGETLLAIVTPAETQLEVPVPETGGGGQRNYQVNLRSCRAPIQVLLIDRDSDSSVPVVFPVPPPDDFCLMPTPPDTPGGLQRFSLATCGGSDSSPLCSQDSAWSDQQMVPVDLSGGATSSSEPAFPAHFHRRSSAASDQNPMDLEVQDFQSVLGVSNLLRLSDGGEHMKDGREELMDDLISADGMDYSFSLDGGGGVSDLFDVSILNY
ncbi:transcription factor E2F5 [Oryzias melastigma]|uniref:E2F transcription factor 5 n=1 Tax=Oryzias melastigma TaxID=30732 RepID=A0A3B3BXN6_ORYME|nr:transcription factor E2F5 [Oryzias melastigma]